MSWLFGSTPSATNTKATRDNANVSSTLLYATNPASHNQAPNLSVLMSSNSNRAARMAAEADIRRLLGEAPCPENDTILAVMFDPAQVARVRQTVQEEQDLLELLSAQSSSSSSAQQQQPAGAESAQQQSSGSGSISPAAVAAVAASPLQQHLPAKGSSGNSNRSSGNNNNNNSSRQEVERWKQKAAHLEATVSSLQNNLATVQDECLTRFTSLEHQALHEQVQAWKDKAAAAETTVQQTQEELVHIRTKARTLALQARGTMEESQAESQAMVTSVKESLTVLSNEWQGEKHALVQEKLELQAVVQTLAQAQATDVETARRADSETGSHKDDIMIASLESKLGAVAQEKNNANAQKEALLQQLTQAQTEAKASQQALVHANDQLHVLEQGVTRRTAEVQSTIDDLEAQLGSAKCETEDLSHQVTELLEAVGSTKQELDFHVNHTTALQNELEAAHVHADQLAVVQRKLEQTTEQVVTFEESLEQKTLENDTMKDEIEKLSVATQQVQDLTAERDVNAQKISALEQELAAVKQQALELSAVTLELQQTQNQVRVLQEDLEKKSSEYNDLKLQVESLSGVAQQVEALTAERDDLKAQIEQRHNDYEETAEHFRQAKTRMKESIAQLEATAVSRTAELQEAAEEIQSLQVQVETAETERESAHLASGALKECHASATELLKSLIQQQQVDHKLQLASAQQEKRAMLAQVKELQIAATDTANRSEAVTASMQTVHQDMTELSKEHETLLHERDGLQNLLLVLEHDKEDLEESVEGLKDLMEEAQLRYSTGKLELENTISQLRSEHEAQLSELKRGSKHEEADVREKLDIAQHALQHAQDNYATLESNLEETKASLQARVKEAESKISQAAEIHLQERDSLAGRLAMLDSELNQAKEQAQIKAENLSSALGEEMQRLVEEREKAVKGKEQADASLKVAQFNVADVEQEKQNLAQKVATLAGSVEKQKIELEEAVEKTSKLQNLLDVASRDGQDLLKVKEAFADSVEESIGTIQKLGHELASVTKQSKEDEQRFAEERKTMRQRVVELEMTVDLKENDVEELAVTLQKTRVDLVKVQSEQSSCLSEIETMKAKIPELQVVKEANSKLTEELETVMHELEISKEDLAKSKQESEAAVVAQGTLSKQITMLETSMEERVKLLEDTQRRLGAVEADNEMLEQQMERGSKKNKPFWQCG